MVKTDSSPDESVGAQPGGIAPAEGSRLRLGRLLGALPIPLFIGLAVAAKLSGSTKVFEPAWLLPILNTIFLSVLPLAVAYVAGMSYLRGGPTALLLLGCGALALALGAVSAGWIIGASDGPNANVTVFDSGALLAAMLHFGCALLMLLGPARETRQKRRTPSLLLPYLAVALFTAVLTFATVRGVVPAFFVQGVGSTLLDTTVLAVASTLLVASGLVVGVMYLRTRTGFLYWYCLAFGLFAIGLICVLNQESVGSLLGWAGRSAHYVGGVYLLMAVLAAAKEARAKGTGLSRAVTGFFRQHLAALVDERTLELAEANEKLRHEISQRERAERGRDLHARVLKLLNQEEPGTDTIKDILLAVKAILGVEAVGIRLREGEDFPYYLVNGLPKAFVETERHLCERDADGHLVCDAEGKPALECMCGNVIRGRIDPTKPFFTEGGSFWTNCTTELLASTTETDRQGWTRNQCNRAGYESLALIPLKSSADVIGLLQLNDHRKGMFTPDLIGLLEDLGASIGIALARTRAEEEIRNLSRFPSENPYPVLRIAADGVVLYANSAGSDLLSSQGSHVGGQVPPDWRDCVSRAIDAASVEERQVELDEKVYVLHFLRVPGTAYVNVYGMDITERLQAEDQFRQAQKMEAIGQLAGGVAHDFRNQLTVIKGYGEMLIRRSLVKAEGLDKLQEILKAAERSAVLTSHLLAFSRKESLQPQLVDLAQLIADMGKSLPQLIGEDIRLQLIPSPQACVVSIDAGQFQHALLNLIANARDAMAGGGVLTIETAVAVPDDDVCRRNPDLKPGAYAIVTVSDTGCGMDEETRSHVFEPFFTSKPAGEGTGLGLSMVYGFTKQSGGAIEVGSEPGKGTTFRMYFRLVPQAATVVAGPSKADLPPGGTETILVVEDEVAIRKMLSELLRESGYTVLEADTAVEGLAKARKAEGGLDMLVTDVVLPGGSGVGLVEKLHKARPQMPVLYVSGYAGKELSRRGVTIDQAHMLTKPFSHEQVLASVRRILDAAKQPITGE